MPARVPTLVKAAVGIITSQREGLWVGMGKEALWQGALKSLRSLSCKPFLPEGARTDTRNPAWPSCLPCRRITAYIRHVTPPPLALAQKPLLPGGSWLSSCQHRRSWMAIQVLLVPRAWARQAGKGRRMCLPLAVPGVESRVWQAGRQALGEVCGVPTVPAACPHSTPPTMAPLFPVARQFGGGSLATHAPLNRGQINPLGDGTR